MGTTGGGRRAAYTGGMPEIPELEAIKGFFNEHLQGRTVASVETRIPTVFRSPAKEFRESLPGDSFGEVHRHGKFLLFTLASDRVLAINPMLTGRFQFIDPKTKVHGKTCLVVTLKDSDRQFRYHDQRLMGKLYLVATDQLGLIPNWDSNGPDLLDPKLDEDAWLARMKKYRGVIKNILTNAEFVQGIGNAYADEILWEAKINPYAKKTELDEADLRRLYTSARAGDGVGHSARSRRDGEGRRPRLRRAPRLHARAPARRQAMPTLRHEHQRDHRKPARHELLPDVPAGRGAAVSNRSKRKLSPCSGRTHCAWISRSNRIQHSS